MAFPQVPPAANPGLLPPAPRNNALPPLVPAANRAPGANLVPAVPPGTQGFQQGDTVVAEVSHLTFGVLELEELGLSENNLALFKVKVDFGGGRQETFRCESTSLGSAYKMVEVFGQQFKQHSNDDAAYERFYKSKVGKTVWMNFDKFGKKGHRSDRSTSFQENSNGNGLEYAFGATSVIVIDEEMRREIKRLAKNHRTAPDDPATVNNDDLVLRADLIA